jgi:hypothetical protein
MKEVSIKESEFLECMNDVSVKLSEHADSKYSNRYGEKNLITAKCTKRYENWLKAYSSALLDTCNNGDSSEQFCREESDRFSAKRATMRQMLEKNFKFATDCEDKQFADLMRRVDEGTLLKEVSCPFKSMNKM